MLGRSSPVEEKTVQNLKPPERRASIEVRPLSQAAGAEIVGVDLTKTVEAATAQAIRDAFLAHHVVVVRGQDLSPDDQTRFCQIFGELGARTRPMALRKELTTGYASDGG